MLSSFEFYVKMLKSTDHNKLQRQQSDSSHHNKHTHVHQEDYYNDDSC